MPLSVTTIAPAGRVQQIERRFQPRFERAQVAVVDADQRRLELQRAFELVGVVHLDQHRHAQLVRQSSSSRIARQLERRGDQQYAVGAAARASCTW